MSDLYDQIVSERGSLERLVARVPGFRGYQEKQARRTADRMLREYIAGQFTLRIDRFIGIEKRILDHGGIAYMTRTRDVKGKMGRLRDTIQTDAPGYSGMFAQVKIGEEELDRIYSFDEAMIRYAEKLDIVLEAMATAAANQEGLEEAIIEVDKVVVEALEAYALRDTVITNLGKTV